jgi:hypothetical protein
MDEKNNPNGTGQTEQENRKENMDQIKTASVTDHHEGNTNNGELGGNFASYDQPVKQNENAGNKESRQ